MAEKGRILLLQGPSSAGKSTLARALQRTLDEYWWRIEADDFAHMLPEWQAPDWWEPAREERSHPSWDTDLRLERWLAAYWGCMVTVAGTGSNVIAVGGWLKTEWLIQAANAFDGFDATCVGVRCPIEECERREVQRGDRRIGYAREQYDVVYEHAPFDLEVDTHSMTTDEMTAHIKTELARAREVPFFERIRREYGRDAVS